MAQNLPTATRLELRTELARRMGNRFFEYFPSTSTVDSGSTDTIIVDDDLPLDDDWWSNRWYYQTSGDQEGAVRWIDDFVAQSGTITSKLTLDRALAGTPAAGDTYQILDKLSPHVLHDAINQALEDGFPSFFETKREEVLVYQEKTIEYSLDGLSGTPYIITGIWLERKYEGSRGDVASSTNNTVTLNDNDLSDVDTDWKITIYEGTGKGQLRDVASVSGQVVTVTSNWTTNPDSTSRYRLWDDSKEDIHWMKITDVSMDAIEYPSIIYIHNLRYDYYGSRIRIAYIARPEPLTADTDTTTVPKEFVINKAMQFLYLVLADNTKHNRAGMERLAQRAELSAYQYEMKRRYNMPAMPLWRVQDPSRGDSYFQNRANPMAWGR